MYHLKRLSAVFLLTGGSALHLSPLHTAAVQRFADCLQEAKLTQQQVAALRKGLGLSGRSNALQVGVVNGLDPKHVLVVAFCSHVAVGLLNPPPPTAAGAAAGSADVAHPTRAQATMLHVLHTCLAGETVSGGTIRAAMQAMALPLTALLQPKRGHAAVVSSPPCATLLLRMLLLQLLLNVGGRLSRQYVGSSTSPWRLLLRGAEMQGHAVQLDLDARGPDPARMDAFIA